VPAETVSRDLQLSQVLSVRLTERQLKRLQKTLRILGIQGGSMSDQLRALFKWLYFKSLRAQVQPLPHVERDSDPRGDGEEEHEMDPEEEEQYQIWWRSYGGEQSL
jgi:hypothetical protein